MDDSDRKPSEVSIATLRKSVESVLNELQSRRRENASLRKENESLCRRLDALEAKESCSAQAMADRARKLCSGTGEETTDRLLRDLKQLKQNELKALGESLDIELSGAKAEMLADMTNYLESGGRVTPPSKIQRAAQNAKKYVDQVKHRMDQIDSAAASEIMRVARAAYADKTLQKDGFAAFTKGLGLTVSGSKKRMLEQFAACINSAAVTHTQTHS